MKIAIAHEMLVKLGGAERVVKTLGDIFPQAPIYTLLYDEKAVEPWFKGKKVIASSISGGLLPRRFKLGKMIKATESLDFSDFDLVISSSSGFMHGVKTGPKTRHICYVHSPMRYAWDYTHKYTENHPKIMRFLIASKLKNIRVWDYQTSKRPDVLIANSKNVQKRIQKYWRKESQVIHPPVTVSRFNPKKEHQNYFLIVSTLTPFKKIDIAIKAFNQNGERLIIIGDGQQRKELEKMAKSNIEFLGRIEDEDIAPYYENCRAFIFPGEEDFGITPVEAMAAGKPVLAYGKGGTCETVQAGISGEFFGELTSESLNDGLQKLLQNENAYDPKKIRQIAEQFDGRNFERKLKELLGV